MYAGKNDRTLFYLVWKAQHQLSYLFEPHPLADFSGKYSMRITQHFLQPDWSAPDHIKAVSTTRLGGCSQPPWDSLNLAGHVGDNPAHVVANRQTVQQALNLPGEPHWLTQVHGVAVSVTGEAEADATYTETPAKVCAVMTADCLPVLFTDRQGYGVAAAHAGWRGLLAGVLENTVACFPQADQVMAWLGPAIGPQAFEVGDAVREQFIQCQAEAARAFVAGRPGHWYANIYQLARQRLQACGVMQISGGGLCTYADAARFFSYRRDRVTGRMASLVWMD